MTRDEARKAFADAGLDYGILDRKSLQELRSRIDRELKTAGYMEGTYRMRMSLDFRETPNGTYAALRCKSHYFENREAVTFNPDGFIGFAGWADDTNVQPILKAFAKWVSEFRPAPVLV